MRKSSTETLTAVLGYADVVILNIGAWYRRTQRQHYEQALVEAAEALKEFSAKPGKIGIIVDTFPMHFVTKRGSGDYFERTSYSQCTDVSPESYFGSGGDWRSRLIRRVAKRHGMSERIGVEHRLYWDEGVFQQPSFLPSVVVYPCTSTLFDPGTSK